MYIRIPYIQSVSHSPHDAQRDAHVNCTAEKAGPRAGASRFARGCWVLTPSSRTAISLWSTPSLSSSRSSLSAEAFSRMRRPRCLSAAELVMPLGRGWRSPPVQLPTCARRVLRRARLAWRRGESDGWGSCFSETRER